MATSHCAMYPRAPTPLLLGTRPPDFSARRLKSRRTTKRSWILQFRSMKTALRFRRPASEDAPRHARLLVVVPPVRFVADRQFLDDPAAGSVGGARGAALLFARGACLHGPRARPKRTPEQPLPAHRGRESLAESGPAASPH